MDVHLVILLDGSEQFVACGHFLIITLVEKRDEHRR